MVKRRSLLLAALAACLPRPGADRGSVVACVALCRCGDPGVGRLGHAARRSRGFFRPEVVHGRVTARSRPALAGLDRRPARAPAAGSPPRPGGCARRACAARSPPLARPLRHVRRPRVLAVPAGRTMVGEGLPGALLHPARRPVVADAPLPEPGGEGRLGPGQPAAVRLGRPGGGLRSGAAPGGSRRPPRAAGGPARPSGGGRGAAGRRRRAAPRGAPPSARRARRPRRARPRGGRARASRAASPPATGGPRGRPAPPRAPGAAPPGRSRPRSARRGRRRRRPRALPVPGVGGQVPSRSSSRRPASAAGLPSGRSPAAEARPRGSPVAAFTFRVGTPRSGAAGRRAGSRLGRARREGPPGAPVALERPGRETPVPVPRGPGSPTRAVGARPSWPERQPSLAPVRPPVAAPGASVTSAPGTSRGTAHDLARPVGAALERPLGGGDGKPGRCSRNGSRRSATTGMRAAVAVGLPPGVGEVGHRRPATTARPRAETRNLPHANPPGRGRGRESGGGPAPRPPPRAQRGRPSPQARRARRGGYFAARDRAARGRPVRRTARAPVTSARSRPPARRAPRSRTNSPRHPRGSPEQARGAGRPLSGPERPRRPAAAPGPPTVAQSALVLQPRFGRSAREEDRA